MISRTSGDGFDRDLVLRMRLDEIYRSVVVAEGMVTTKCRRLRRASAVAEDRDDDGELLRAKRTEGEGQREFAKLRGRKEEGSAAAASTTTFTG